MKPKEIQPNIKQRKKFVIFTLFGEGLPLAKKLIDEGYEVFVGIINNLNDALLPEEEKTTEEPEDKKLRLKNYDGILTKQSAVELYKWLITQNPEEFFVIGDLNVCYKYTEKLAKKGFTGILATEDDRRLEVNREMAKEFVEKYYTDLKVAENHTFDKVDEAIQFLEEDEENLWVVKSLGDHVGVKVTKDDLLFNRKTLINHLTKNQKDYEKGKIILEKKIENACEITPQAVWYDGELVYTSLDIETKEMLPNTGIQCGCSSMVTISTNPDDLINQIAFPPKIHEMASERKGLFIWDASIYLSQEGELFFGEFCACRFGYSSLFAEIEQSGSAGDYFESIMDKQNPLMFKYGLALNIFNIGKEGAVKDEIILYKSEIEDSLYLYDVYKKDEDLFNTGCMNYDLAVVTSANDDLYDGITELYENVNDFCFGTEASRRKEDFICDTYSSALIQRFNKIKEYGLINVEDYNETDVQDTMNDIMQDEIETEED